MMVQESPEKIPGVREMRRKMRGEMRKEGPAAP
jgi:hypothetical protein